MKEVEISASRIRRRWRLNALAKSRTSNIVEKGVKRMIFKGYYTDELPSYYSTMYLDGYTPA